MQGKLIIKAEIPEQDFMESLLNMKSSGVTNEYILLATSLYALAHSWHIDKLSYYLRLLEVSQNRTNKK